MMQNHSLSKAKPSVLSRRINVAGIGAVAAAAALMFSPESAQAAVSKEYKALKTAVEKLGATLDTASAEQLKTAITEILADSANAKLKPGVLAGEALKTKAALNGFAGNEIAEAFNPANLDATARQTLLGLAAKTAGTGKKANPAEVSDFTAALLQAADTDVNVIAAAITAKASKTAVAEIFEGAAFRSADLNAQITLAKAALGDKKLASALSQIAAGVAASVADGSTDEYALSLSEQFPKLVTKIIGGIAATDTQNAGEIVNKLINTANGDLKTSLQKGIPAIAKSVSKVADIEQISLIGAYLAEKIGSNATAGPKNKPLVSLASAKSLTTTLAKAIIAKPQGSGSLSANNRADELAEVAANVVGGIIGVSSGLDVKKAPKLVLSIIQAAVKGGTATKKQKLQAAADHYIADIVASVAHTIAASNLDSTVVNAIKDFLLKPSNAKKINKDSTAVIAALTEGFAVTSDVEGGRFENGNLIAQALRPGGSGITQALLDRIVDPETDKQDYLAAAN